MAMISDHLARLKGRIEDACLKIDRDPEEITLVGVTKYANAAQVKEAIEAGLRHIGENRVQDAKEKFAVLDQTVTKHMIGHLQTNKVKQALELFDMIQSVDSLKLAQEIEKQAAAAGKKMDVLIQVNVAAQAQKFGARPDQMHTLLTQIKDFEHINVCGFMTMAPLTENKDAIRSCFRGLRELRDAAKAGFPSMGMHVLSMGMSDDYEIALEEGSNMIRLGRAIFSDK